MENSTLKNILDNIIYVINKESATIDDIGLYNGKTGMAVFLYLYSRFFNDENSFNKAETLIEEANDLISGKTPINYSNGLLGYGTALEYLVKKGVLNLNTEEYFSDLDNLVKNASQYFDDVHIKHIVGYGKYIIYRLSNLSNNEKSDKELVAGKLVDTFNRSIDYYDHGLCFINYLADTITLNINQEKSYDYIKYAIDKIETMVHEDVHFKIYPGMFNPLVLAALLVQAYIKTNEILFKEKALYFLTEYESNFRKYLSVDIDGLSSGGFKWSVLYKFLGDKLGLDEYLKLSDEWLQYSIDKYNEIIINQYQQRMPLSMWNGYAQIGLSLLYLMDGCSDDFLDIFIISMV